MTEGTLAALELNLGVPNPMPRYAPPLPELSLAPFQPAIEPRQADVLQLIDLLARHPDLEESVLSLATSMLVRVDTGTLEEGLNARWSTQGEPAVNRVVSELTDQLGVSLALDHTGEAQPSDVLQLVDLVRRHPELESQVVEAACLTLRRVTDISDVRRGLEARAEQFRDPGMNRVIGQLLDEISVDEMVSEHSDDEVANVHWTDAAADALDADIAMQTEPLSYEMLAWVPEHALSGAADAFDEETDAVVFARMLARMRMEHRDQGSDARAERLTEQVSSVIAAIVGDERLRRKVFLIAKTALGSCTDNLVEGFSKVLLAVDSHELVGAVKSGKMDAKGLDRWAGRMFRLSLLETAVNRFIAAQLKRTDLPPQRRRDLEEERVETMLHAKVALREQLDLPDSTPSEMQFMGMSAVTPANLIQLECEVKSQAANREADIGYRLRNPVWCDAMKAMYAQEFDSLEKARDNDPFFDLPLPKGLEEEVRYAETAREVDAKWQRREDDLLRRLDEGGR
jgi:hypothetical protein